MKRNLKEAILGIEVTQFDGYKADLEEFVNPQQLEEIINDWMPEVLSSDWIKNNQRMWTSIHGLECYVPANKLYGKIVPKQELPVVPKFVAGWFEENKENFESKLKSIIKYPPQYDEDVTDFTRWVSNSNNNPLKTLGNMFNGYEVEEEPKYYARIKGWENVTTGSEAFNWVYFKEEDTVGISKAVENKYQSASLTKYDWDNLGINEHNADFVLVEELEE